jgi:bacillithiol synthase
VGRAFSTSYLAGEPAAQALLARDFRRPGQRIATARRAAGRRIDPALVAVLREQQAQLPPSATRERNLDALAAGDTAAVVSGQQVGLFLGPLYTFYKAASAIAVARAIAAESGVRTVPVFWLQTEDHDFAEIACCTTAGADGVPVRLALADEPAAAVRVSVAHRRLGSEITGLVEALAAQLGTAPAAREVVDLLRAHYVPGRPLAMAFAGALAEIFADEGLLFLDPRDARIATLTAPIYRRAIVESVEIDRQLLAQGQRLLAAGFSQQVAVRAGSPLIFFHRHGPEGPRHRLQAIDAGDPDDPAWRLLGSDEIVTREALLRAVDVEPLRFSTSALLRPIVQDTLLPTVAYVGGEAEVNYFAQVDPLYAHFDVAAPLVVPRARFRCVEAPARRWLDALGLQPDDLAQPLAALLARVVTPPVGAPDPQALRRRVAEEIAPVVDQIAGAISAADPALARAGQRTRASVDHALSRLTRRYAQSLGARDTVARQRLLRAQAALFPGGEPQERVFGWPTLAARLGSAAFKRLVFDQLAVAGAFTTVLQELRP